MYLKSKAPLTGLFAICSQSVGASYPEHGVPTVEPAVRALAEEFNQQAIYQRSASESIDRQDYQTSLSAQKDTMKNLPLPPMPPLSDPRTEPPIPRT